MTAYGLQPLYLRDATLSIATPDGDTDFTAAVSEVTFWPEVEWEWTDLLATERSAASFPTYTRTRWTVTVTYVQDMNPGSLTRYLFEQAATERDVTFTVPGVTVAADVMLVPGPMGGPGGQTLTATVTLPLFGEPVVS